MNESKLKKEFKESDVQRVRNIVNKESNRISEKIFNSLRS
jgi:hypothetical protein